MEHDFKNCKTKFTVTLPSPYGNGDECEYEVTCGHMVGPDGPFFCDKCEKVLDAEMAHADEMSEADAGPYGYIE